MKTRETRLRLGPRMFRRRRRELLTFGGLSVSTFRYRTGVCALRIANEQGRIDVLPFQGQQIWAAVFNGRRLAMQTPFRHPLATTEYMKNNGAYLIHCGGSAMGNPSPADRHPPHGELPNARHSDVELVLLPGETNALRLEGGFRSTTGFGPYFGARTSVTMRERSALLESHVEITNLSAEPRPLMYLAHLNYRPAVGGRVIDLPALDAQPLAREGVQIGPVGSVSPVSKTALDTGFLQPEDLLKPGVRVEPELVQILPGHRRGPSVLTAQLHSDGSADIVEHSSPNLTHIVRWLRRSADDQAYGFALPATAESDGFLSEDAKGNVRRYAPGDALIAHYTHGMVPRWSDRPDAAS